MSLELASTLTLFQNAPLSFSVKPDVLRHFKINQLQSRYWFRPRHANTSRYPSVWAFCLECAMSRSGKIRPLVWRMGTAWTLDNRLFMMLFVNRVLILALHFISSLSIPHTKSHIASPDTVLESWAPKHELYPERYALKQIRNCFFIEGWTFKKILKYFLWKV